MIFKTPFNYELIEEACDSYHYRIHDANDNRVATCWDEGNAKLIVEALNVAHNEPNTLTEAEAIALDKGELENEE